ncbi:MAG: MvaI/BcnI family restriction endonuclease, partial [Verrucomicrobiia bacterium]
NLKELKLKLEEIKRRGFVCSMRTGTTGIGYTFELLLGIKENNLPIPDIGGRTEIKTIRKDSQSLLTLFTFNKGVWNIKQKDLILKYGYIDEKNRYALKNTVFYGKHTAQGMSLELDEDRNLINLVDKSKNEILANWDVYVIVGKFMMKMSRLLLVMADRKTSDENEYFHYNEAFLLSNPSPRSFINAFKKQSVGIDLRMHLKENGAVRNRGTAFRIKESDFVEFYENRIRLV